MPVLLLRNIAFLLATVLSLCACAPGATAIADSVRYIKSRSDGSDVRLAPGVGYLRVESGGGITIMALGYVEPGPDGVAEVWYSPAGEVLKLRNGRVVGTFGLPNDWREVRLPALPSWRQADSAAIRYERMRDEMPGYRMNVKDTIFVRAIAAPADATVIGFNAGDLAWYEEQAIASVTGGTPPLPSARFALAPQAGQEIVVYGEQCIAPSLCLTWQRWPPPAGVSQ